jgi:hypothetical protein
MQRTSNGRSILFAIFCSGIFLLPSTAASQTVAASDSESIAIGANSAPCETLQDRRQIKYTCGFPGFVFTHDGSGAHDALVGGVKVQFVLDASGSSDVETVIQGVGQGVTWSLTISAIELSFTDAAGIRRVINSRIAPQSGHFVCRQSSHEFSAIVRSQRSLVIDALRQGSRLNLSMDASLRTGIPGAGY